MIQAARLVQKLLDVEDCVEDKVDVGSRDNLTVKYDHVPSTSDSDRVFWSKLQRKDRRLRMVHEWLVKGERPDYQDICDQGFYLRSLWSQWNTLVLQDGMIYRCFKDPGTNSSRMQCVIPLSKRSTVLQFCHEDNCTKRISVKDTLANVRLRYFWPSWQRDVRVYVHEYDKCTRKKHLGSGELKLKYQGSKMRTLMDTEVGANRLGGPSTS